jgi:putative endonuclease
MIKIDDSTKKNNWFVYIIQCNDKSYYTGITNNLEKRIKNHNLGTASKYTRIRLPVHIVYKENNFNRSTASKREYAIKQLNRTQKEKLIKQNTIK